MERKGQGQDYHELDDDDKDNGKGEKQGKSINDSISEHRCILTSYIIYSISLDIYLEEPDVSRLERYCTNVLLVHLTKFRC